MGGGPALPRVPRMYLGSSQAQKQREGHLYHSVKSLCVLGSSRSDNVLQALASLPYTRSISILKFYCYYSDSPKTGGENGQRGNSIVNAFE